MKFDTNLNLSPVYVDEDLLIRHGACSMAREEFRETFGDGARIPVTRRNFVRAGEELTWLEGSWLAYRFLSAAEQQIAADRYWRDTRGRSLEEIQWPYVRRELKRRYPEWYAARAAR